MFIEVTDWETGNKFIINSMEIMEINIQDGKTQIHTGLKIGALVKESYDSIRTLLNTKWVAE